ncbi:hypothetical protein [Hypericibacter sp.]|uniref:hypothetical protein n=1 Tax=Hypericibacter sp. TaxID=2705401 RepID=UPI003D6D9C2B
MLLPARKLAFLAIALAGGLITASSHSLADDSALRPDRIGIADAVPVADQQMGELRGTGFLGSFTAALSAALGHLPTASLNGPGVLFLSCSNGISCAPGTTIKIFGSNQITPGSSGQVTVITAVNPH